MKISIICCCEQKKLSSHHRSQMNQNQENYSTPIQEDCPPPIKIKKTRVNESENAVIIALDDPEMTSMGIFGPNQKMSDNEPAYVIRPFLEQSDSGAVLSGEWQINFNKGWPQMGQKRVMDALLKYCEDYAGELDKEGYYYLDVKKFITKYLSREISGGNLKQLYRDLVVLSSITFSKEIQNLGENIQNKKKLIFRDSKLLTFRKIELTTWDNNDGTINYSAEIPFYIDNGVKNKLGCDLLTPTDMRLRNELSKTKSTGNKQHATEALYLFLNREFEKDIKLWKENPNHKKRNAVVIMQDHLFARLNFDLNVDETKQKYIDLNIDQRILIINKDKRHKIAYAKERVILSMQDLIAKSIIRAPYEGEEQMIVEKLNGRSIEVEYRFYFGSRWTDPKFDIHAISLLTDKQRELGIELVKTIFPDFKDLRKVMATAGITGAKLPDIVKNVEKTKTSKLYFKDENYEMEWDIGEFSAERIYKLIEWFKKRQEVIKISCEFKKIDVGCLIISIYYGTNDAVLESEINRINKIMSDYEDRKKDEKKLEQKKKEDKKIEEERLNNLMMEAQLKRTTLKEFEKIVLKYVKYELSDLDRVKKIIDNLKKYKWFSEGDVVFIPVGNMLHYYSCHDRSLLSDVILTGNWRPLEEKCLKLDIIRSRSKLSKDEQNAIKKHNGSIMNKMSSSNLVFDRDFIFAKFENESEIYIVANKDVGDIGDRLKKISVDEALEKIKI